MLRASNIQDSRFTNRAGVPGYQVNAEFIADTTDYSLWELINSRLVNRGLTLYESESIHEEVLASVVSGHEAEKAALGDQLRLARDSAAILGQQLSHCEVLLSSQSAELERLRALERELGSLAALTVTAGGKIGA